MRKIAIGVQKEFCAECSLALTRFIGRVEGVASIDVENGMISISFDDAKLLEEDLARLTRESVEKLGYKIVPQ